MKAKPIDKRSFISISKQGLAIIVKMDLYQIQDLEAYKRHEGYRFSWIASSIDDPSKKVLFDPHHIHGSHFHINDKPMGVSFQWESLEKAERLFFDFVSIHFNIDPEELT